eukprot:TRINITY_DN46798_c0_g1_i2.p1 TRINITY_DN46798_c0_g1~~TRINITY_DN46798_c0_g1_i2.p1  ORF type:complete len:153 (-),score=21.19 TRINITY_DN46798_c0_g1_i2:353-811(-)
MSEAAMNRAWRLAVHDADGYGSSSCPLERTIAEGLQELLPPPPPFLEREVVAAGVRDLAKLKRVRAAGCKTCSGYKSVRACGDCVRRPHESDSREDPNEAVASSSFLARIHRPVEHRSIEHDDLPHLVDVRLPADPKPENVRRRSVSRVKQQ